LSAGNGQTDADELLQAARAFLREEVVPQLEGFTAYGTRVAANSLAIVARELELAPRLAALDAEAAERFALDPAQGPVGRQLSLRLRDAGAAPGPELLSYLRRRTLLQLAIDNPRYSGYLQAGALWPAEAEE
jgi:hypothetical protein